MTFVTRLLCTPDLEWLIVAHDKEDSARLDIVADPAGDVLNQLSARNDGNSV